MCDAGFSETQRVNQRHQTNNRIGTCALCDQENVILKESHSIPKFVYDWIKDTSATPYLRSSDNINVREQDGPKEYLLCGRCEGSLSRLEKQLAEKLFKRIANYRGQAREIVVTDAMRAGVLSIFWRTLLTSLNRENERTEEDKCATRKFLASAKNQIKQRAVTTRIYFAPIYGEPPFYGLPNSMTYMLDRMVGAPDIRFFDDPHRYYAVFKLPFMFFYVRSDGWADAIPSEAEFSGSLRLGEIRYIPTFLRDYIFWLDKQFEVLKQSMSAESLEQIAGDLKQNQLVTGAQKSMTRSRADKT